MYDNNKNTFRVSVFNLFIIRCYHRCFSQKSPLILSRFVHQLPPSFLMSLVYYFPLLELFLRKTTMGHACLPMTCIFQKGLSVPLDHVRLNWFDHCQNVIYGKWRFQFCCCTEIFFNQQLGPLRYSAIAVALN